MNCTIAQVINHLCLNQLQQLVFVWVQVDQHIRLINAALLGGVVH